jgi:hypothetical protein
MLDVDGDMHRGELFQPEAALLAPVTEAPDRLAIGPAGVRGGRGATKARVHNHALLRQVPNDLRVAVLSSNLKIAFRPPSS